MELQGLGEHVFLSRGQTIDACNACTLQNLLDKSQHLQKQQAKSAFQETVMRRMALPCAGRRRLDCCMHTATLRHQGLMLQQVPISWGTILRPAGLQQVFGIAQ